MSWDHLDRSRGRLWVFSSREGLGQSWGYLGLFCGFVGGLKKLYRSRVTPTSRRCIEYVGHHVRLWHKLSFQSARTGRKSRNVARERRSSVRTQIASASDIGDCRDGGWDPACVPETESAGLSGDGPTSEMLLAAVRCPLSARRPPPAAHGPPAAERPQIEHGPPGRFV